VCLVCFRITMSTTEEATVNPDGSTTFEGDETFNATAEEDTFAGGEDIPMEDVVKGVDPAIYLGLFVLALGLLWFFVLRSQNKEEDEFFAELDVEKVSLWSLPVTVSLECIRDKAITSCFYGNLHIQKVHDIWK